VQSDECCGVGSGFSTTSSKDRGTSKTPTGTSLWPPRNGTRMLNRSRRSSSDHFASVIVIDAVH